MALEPFTTGASPSPSAQDWLRTDPAKLYFAEELSTTMADLGGISSSVAACQVKVVVPEAEESYKTRDDKRISSALHYHSSPLFRNQGSEAKQVAKEAVSKPLTRRSGC